MDRKIGFVRNAEVGDRMKIKQWCGIALFVLPVVGLFIAGVIMDYRAMIFTVTGIGIGLGWIGAVVWLVDD